MYCKFTKDSCSKKLENRLRFDRIRWLRLWGGIFWPTLDNDSAHFANYPRCPIAPGPCVGMGLSVAFLSVCRRSKWNTALTVNNIVHRRQLGKYILLGNLGEPESESEHQGYNPAQSHWAKGRVKVGMGPETVFRMGYEKYRAYKRLNFWNL